MMQPAQLSTYLVTFEAEDPGDWSHLSDFARAADAAGFDRMVVSDHVAFGDRLEVYADPSQGGIRDGVQPTGPDGLWLDPLVTVAHLSALTSRIRFGTAILLAALRRPVVLAKMAATIDVLSGGRFELGVGVGWQREEYEAAGLSFADRGRLLDRTIAVCQELWGNRTASYQDDELAFHNIHQMPKPIQDGGVPIWISGTVNSRAMDRLAHFGAGWIPWGDDTGDIGAGIVRMRAAMIKRNRDPDEIGVVGALPVIRNGNERLDLRRTMEHVARLYEAGVTVFQVNFSAAEKQGDIAEVFGETVSAFRAASA
jgi:probable F420-dependent oxidoreductase